MEEKEIIVDIDDDRIEDVLEENDITEDQLTEQFNKFSKKTEKLLEDEDKLERFLQRLEKKLKSIPVVGEKMAMVPVLISLVRAYVKKEYEDIPIGTIVSILGALAYILAPIDLIPDQIPVIGYIDDMAVLSICLKLVQSDIDEYLAWRSANDKEI
ncbi:MAG: DUF1232 domain-containing protein [Lachnospiraceae bacterium]|nr:DUF1232 domain-containing protein [Lachnospiraceae bacterium]